MIKVVLDTNVIVASILTNGSPKAIFDLSVKRRIAWFFSDPILAEYRRVLEYPRLKIAPASIRKTLWAVKKHGRLVSPGFEVDQAGEEPNVPRKPRPTYW
jgi:putative PIN family toxin of toxin-antitoxin system